MTIKAIETEYNGYRFRSRLEARWAVFFDAMGIEYQYEPEGFDLGDGYYYLPDFYMPEHDVWVEIKGKALTEEEREKIERFCRAKCDLSEGGSRFRLLEGDIPAIILKHKDFPKPGIPCFNYLPPKAYKEIAKADTEPNHGILVLGMWTSLADSWNFENLQQSLLKARQARFEHGEKPTI